MRTSLFIAAGMMLAAGCSSSFPASPVPARLTDREAALLGDRFLIDKGAPPTRVTSIEPTEQGYLFHYVTYFDAPSSPPKQVRLLNIHNDGTVREIWFPHEE